MNIKVAATYDQNKVLEIIDSFDELGETYWKKKKYHQDLSSGK